MIIAGSIVALVTPMLEDNSIDFEAFKKLIDFHIHHKTDGIVVASTTGEAPTLNSDEYTQLIQIAVERSAGRIPIIVGATANSTEKAIHLAQRAKDIGADAVLSVVPYYNKPTQEGIYQHYLHITEVVDLPLILYNVPGRTGIDMENDTILRLAQIPHVIGIKDATGDIRRACELVEHAPPNFALYSGDDITCMSTILLGYHGCISVTANIAPLAMHDMCVIASAKKFARAVQVGCSLTALHRHLFCESNPIPVKWALSELGLIPPGIRLPLTRLSPCFHEILRNTIKQAGMY